MAMERRTQIPGLIQQGGTLVEFQALLARKEYSCGVMLGPDTIDPLPGSDIPARQVTDPWRNVHMNLRLEQAYQRATLLVQAIQDAMPGVALKSWGMDMALLHEVMFTVTEPWISGIRSAEFAADLKETRSPFNIYPSRGLQGHVFDARLRNLCSMACTGPRHRVKWGNLLDRDWLGIEELSFSRKLARLRHFIGALVETSDQGRPHADVLVVELYANRLRNMGEVITRLRSNKRSLLLLSMARAQKERDRLMAEVRRLDLPCLPWELGLLSMSHCTFFRRLSKLIAGLLRCSGAVRELLHEDGLSKEVIHQLTNKIIAELVQRSTRTLMLTELLGAVLDRTKPKLVLTSRGDGTILRLLGRLAESRCVPVLDIEHGKRLLVSSPIIRDLPWVHFALTGQGSVELYAAAGVSLDQLHPVGSPAFDRLLEESRMPLDEQFPRPYLLYCSNATHIHRRWDPGSAHLRLLCQLNTCLDELPDMHLVIKLHPQEYGEATRKKVAQLSNQARIQIVENMPNGTLIGNTSMQISMGSTTSIEAVLLGIPAIYMDFFQCPIQMDVALQQGAIERINNLEDLMPAIKRCLGRRIENKRVEHYYAHKLDGRSVDRILDIGIVKELLVDRR